MNKELIRLSRKAAAEWPNTDGYQQAGQLIEMLCEELEDAYAQGPSEPRIKSRAEAFRVIGKHVFKAYRTYGDPEDTILIILADTLEDAKAKAKERWDSPFITVKPATPTQDPQVYEV